MRSIDRDFDADGIAKHNWTLAYVLIGLGVVALVGRFWDEVHIHGLSVFLLIRIVATSLICICPMIFCLQSRRYTKSALKENLVSERVAHNYEFIIGMQVLLTYIAVVQLAMWS